MRFYSSLGEVVADATPHGSVDFIKLWANIKTALRAKRGTYSGGSYYTPVLTGPEITELRKAWEKAGADLLAAVSRAGRDTGYVERANFNFTKNFFYLAIPAAVVSSSAY